MRPGQPPRRPEHQRQGNNPRRRQNDRRPRGQTDPAAGDVAEGHAPDAGGGSEHARQQNHAAEAVRPLPRRRGRGHQQRRHQHHADRLQAHNHRHHRQRGQQQVEPADGEAEAAGVIGVERQQLELLPEQHQQQGHSAAQAGDHHQVVVAEVGGVAVQVTVERVPRRVLDVVLRVRHQDEPEPEEHRQRAAEGGVEGHARAARDRADRRHRQPPRHGPAEDQLPRFARAEKERHREPRQGRVRHHISLETLPAENRERADRTGREAEPGGARGDRPHGRRLPQ